jgi:hypothetical protein
MKKLVVAGLDGFEPEPVEGTFARNAPSPAGSLLLAAFFGLFTGLIESPLLGVQKLLSARALLLGTRVVWMAPVADLLLFVAVGLLLLVLSWRWKGARSAPVAMTVFGFMTSLSWLLIFPRIQWYASSLLAIGVAAQCGRFFARRRELSYSSPEACATSPVLSEVNVAPIRPGRYPVRAPARMRSVLWEGRHYIRNANGREELYDILKDPAEQTNLENEAELQPLIEQLRCVLDKLF